MGNKKIIPHLKINNFRKLPACLYLKLRKKNREKRKQVSLGVI